ncbi:MAG TPA: intradiol ring-cleavage dioxygenase, partial [Marinagarivorans sp.]|nr:intradiol ring-cleavage dioxygenase [Marinagarivorans sp.]
MNPSNCPNPAQLNRRETLGMLSLLGAVSLAGCAGSKSGASGSAASSSSSSSSSSNSSSSTSSSSSGGVGQCVLIPQETIGPYPLSAILSNSAMVRRDVTEGKSGVPLRLTFKLVNTQQGCNSFPYASVYIWHCDKDGVYSGYSQPGANTVGQTFLRGIQDTDANGEVTFNTIFPGWYNGRVTHIHFQIFLYNNLSGNGVAISQLAFPDNVVRAVYNSPLYSARGQNSLSLSADNVFSDGTQYQMASITGDINNGFEAFLQVG